MGELVKANYNDIAVSFTEDAWFNATVVAEKFGKRPVDWLRLPETERYLDALCRRSEVGKSHFTLTRKGNYAGSQHETMIDRLRTAGLTPSSQEN